MDIALPVFGALLLALLFYDVLITVFHPQGRGGPINRIQDRLVWSGFRAIGMRRDGTPRSRLLSFCGPLLAVLTIVIWALTLVLGFTLIYYPWIASFLVSPGMLDRSWVEALYYSGYVASTLGIGDVVPTTAPLRLLTVVEAFGGFALLTVSITYMGAVYRELSQATGLAVDISNSSRRLTGQASGADGSESAPSRAWVNRTTRTLLRVTHAHTQYPIIEYFHPTTRARALPVQLGPLIDFSREAESPDAGDRGAEQRSRPCLARLRSAVRAHLDEMETSLVPGSFEPLGEPAREASLERRHKRVLRYLLYSPRPDRHGPEAAAAGTGLSSR